MEQRITAHSRHPPTVRPAMPRTEAPPVVRAGQSQSSQSWPGQSWSGQDGDDRDPMERTRPELELVEVPPLGSFKVWSHGYPYRTVRWHFHPEYELHLVTATSGTFFVGDHVGNFTPGQLVLVGPNLPHNWVSRVAPGEEVRHRCVVLQFAREFIEGCVASFPELRALDPLLAASACGMKFSPEAGAAALPILTELLHAQGARRVALFFGLLDLLSSHGAGTRLASAGYHIDVSGYMASEMNYILATIGRSLGGNLREGDLARLVGFSASKFSRTFRRHTGMTFVRYVNRLRIERACRLLLDDGLTITEICYRTGFNNLSNFNRQFLEQRGIPPSRYRHDHRAHGIGGPSGPPQRSVAPG